jgi:hypothetical protein
VIFTACGAYINQYWKQLGTPYSWNLAWPHLLVWDIVPKFWCMTKCSPESPIMQWHQRKTQPIYEKVIAPMAPNDLRRLDFLIDFRLHYYTRSSSLSQCFVLRPYFQEGWKILQSFATEPVHMTGNEFSSFYNFLRFDHTCLWALQGKILSREEFEHNIGERIRIIQHIADQFSHIDSLEPRLLENMIYLYAVFFYALHDRIQHFSDMGSEKNKLCALARPYQDRLQAMLKRREQVLHQIDFDVNFSQGDEVAGKAYRRLQILCPTNPLSTKTTHEVTPHRIAA